MPTNYTLDKLKQHFTVSINDLLPTQSGKTGQFLTTNGEAISWATVETYTLPNATTSSLGGVIVGSGLSVNNGTISITTPIPAQTNNSGKYLTTDGTDLSWSTVDVLPSKTGNSGKYLYTDGTNAAWADLPDYLLRSGGTLTGNIYGRPVVGSSSSATGDDLPVLFVSKDNTLNKGGTLDKARYFTLGVATDATGSLTNDHKFGQVQVSITTAGEISTELVAYRNASGNTNQAKLAISQTKNGTVKTYAPTPPANDNSTQIATTAWVNTVVGDVIPDQTSNSGKYLTTDGSVLSWTTVDALPAQSGNSGKYLTTNGTTASWATVDTLPSQSGNSGKFLTTDGTNASWSDILNEIKLSSIHYPTANATTIVLTQQQAIPSTVSKYSMSVYRDGIYLNPSVDYGYNNSNRTLTFNRAFEADEVVTVLFTYLSTDSQTMLDLDVEEYEAGDGITFTDNPITNKITISSDSALPSLNGNSGKYLTNDGTDLSWSTVDALPSQSGNSGKYLTTNGTTAAWSTISSYTLPIAASDTLGGIKVGTNLSIDSTTGVLSATDTTYSDATTSTSGLMSATDKTKLDGLSNYTLPTASDTTLGGIKVGTNLSIDSNGILSSTDTVYTHPTTAGNKHIPSGGSSGKILVWSADGTATWGNDNDTVTTVSTTGEGNAVTSITANNGALTVTKGSTFSLSTHNHDTVYAPLASPALTGTPTAPTATAGTNSTQIATTAYVDTAVSNLVNSAPAALDTLSELSAALGDDPNFATTVATNIGNKLDSNSANYVKSLSISGTTITITKGNDTTSTLTTQDTVYTHPTTSGNKHIPSGGSSGKILVWSSDGTAEWGDDNDTVTTVSNTGEGNAVTSITANNGALTVTLGKTFSETNHTHVSADITDKLTKSSVGATQWSSLVGDRGKVIDMQYLSYWNGAYQSSSSNLEYCKQGKIGSMATKSASDYVKVIGDTMTGDLTLSDSRVWVKCTDITKGTFNGVSSTTNAIGILDSSSLPIGVVYEDYKMTSSSNYKNQISLLAYDPTTTNYTFSTLGIGYNQNGVYTVAPTPDTSDNSTKIATTAFVKAQGYITSSSDISGNAATATTATKLGTTDVGSGTQPIYLNDGVPTATTYTLGKSVPSDAVFTDTTYSVFVGSGSSAASGLVPAPPSTTGTSKYLREDGSWVQPSDTFDRVKSSNSVKAASAITSKKIIVGTSSGYVNADSGVTFDLEYPIMYAGSNVASGNNGTNNYFAYPSATFNSTLSTFSGEDGEEVFLVGTINGNHVTIDSSVITTTKPTTQDGKIYIQIGKLSSTTVGYFYPNGQIFEYKNGAFRLYDPTTVTSGSSNGTVKVNGTDVSVYVHPTGSGSKHIPSGGSSGQVLTWSSDGTAVWGSVSTLPSQTGNSGKYLTTNGTTASWSTISTYTLPTASASVLGGIKVGTNLSIDANGVLSSTDTVYTHPTTSGNKHIPSGGASGNVLTWSADGTAVWGTVDPLPSQTDNSGKFLTTNGTTASWSDIFAGEVRLNSIHHPSANDTTITLTSEQAPASNIDKWALSVYRDGIFFINGVDYTYAQNSRVLTFNEAFEADEVVSVNFAYLTSDSGDNRELPAQTGNSGKFLTTDGTDVSWANVDALPSQTGNSGYYLTTNGTTASWDNLLSSPAFTGVPTAPTATAGTNSTQIATTAYVDTAVSSLVNSAPTTLDTLNELAAALGDDPNFATTVSTSLGNKLDSNSANYVKSLSISGQTITVTKGNNTTSTLTTQDTTYTAGSGLTLTGTTFSADDQLPSQTGNSGKFLTTDGTNASWSDIINEIKISSLHYPSANATTITLTEQQAIPSTTNKYAMSVYRNGIYLNPSIDYGYNTNTRVLTFVVPFGTDEVVNVIFSYLTTDSQNVLDLDIAEYEAGDGITFTDNAITNKVIISATGTFPSQTGNSGKFLMTNGSAVSWEDVDALPDQTNNANKFLTTDGTDAYWTNLFSSVQEFSTVAGENTVTLPSNFISSDQYDSMVVFLDGIRLVRNTDYIFNSTTGVLTFADTFISGDVVTVGLYTNNYDLETSTGIPALSNGILTSNGTTMSWKSFTKMIYTYDTTSANDIVIIPQENLTDAVVTDVYRNGLLMVLTDDYTINSSTREITFVVPLAANEKIVVVTQNIIVNSSALLTGASIQNSTANTPLASDNSNSIATTAFVNSVLNNYVPTAINNRFANPIEKVNILASAATISIDPNAGSLFTLTLATNATITIGNISNGPYTINGATITLYMDNTNNTISWDSNKIQWLSGSAPDVTTNPSVITFVTFNGGSKWYGSSIEVN